MTTKYIIVYQTDNHDLYTKKFKSREKVDKWLEKNEYFKTQVIEITGKTKIKVEDHT